MYVLLVSPGSVSLYAHLFFNSSLVRDALNNPKITLKTVRPTVLHICVTGVPASQILLDVLLYNQLYYRPFWKSAKNDPPSFTF